MENYRIGCSNPWRIRLIGFVGTLYFMPSMVGIESDKSRSKSQILRNQKDLNTAINSDFTSNTLEGKQ